MQQRKSFEAGKFQQHISLASWSLEVCTGRNSVCSAQGVSRLARVGGRQRYYHPIELTLSE
ncbi:hypothetical protein F383_18183 [Gossypium arboreum]|uniref:Uncharacterized protein n=1 Tax=Gossypium arboreum TaxID=29729 RepID=A0A0B0NSI1_GOSAR|nr:hypothetical protein F383_18183 [Gossypium arboreum]